MRAGTLIAAVVLMRSPCADGSCQILEGTRPLPGPGGGKSQAGGLLIGEAFYSNHGHSPQCVAGGVMQPGSRCDVVCNSGYGDLDAGEGFRGLTCGLGGGGLQPPVYTQLPMCQKCDEFHYKVGTNSEACKRCPPNSRTGKDGATSQADCNQCVETAMGTYPNCRERPRPAGWNDCPTKCNPDTDKEGCSLPWSPHESYRFSNFIGDAANCSVVNIIGVMRTPSAGDSGTQWWDGLKLVQEHINMRGGLRLGEGKVGYLNITILTETPSVLASGLPRFYTGIYQGLCLNDPDAGAGTGWSAHVQSAPKAYLTPPNVEDDVSQSVLKLSETDCYGAAVFLAGSEVKFPEQQSSENWRGVFSIYGQESELIAPGENTTSPITMLYNPPYNARTFGISGVQTPGWDKLTLALKAEISRKPGASLTNKDGDVVLATSTSAPLMNRALQPVAQTNPDVFIGIGNGADAFEGIISFFGDINAVPGLKKSSDFKETEPHTSQYCDPDEETCDKEVAGYSPKAAFYLGGLSVNSEVIVNSYNPPGPGATVGEVLEIGSNSLPCTGGCWSFDQWMGFVPWTSDMPHKGLLTWPEGLANPYGMVNGPDETPDRDADQDCHSTSMRHRYLGSAQEFNTRMFEWMKTHGGGSPTFYHAKAAASVLLFQTAIELAPDGGGYGLVFEELTLETITKAIGDVTGTPEEGLHTFWGPIRIRPGDMGQSHSQGWNMKYTIGIGQFRNNQTYPSLVDCSAEGKTTAVYPAQWPDYCLVKDTHFSLNGACPSTYLRTTEIILFTVLAVVLVLALIVSCCWYMRRRDNRYAESAHAIRRSLLGSTELPDTILTNRNIASRWATTRVAAQASEAFGVSTPRGNGASNRSHVVASGGGTPRTPTGSMNSFGSAAMRVHSGLLPQTQVPVMFTDKHVRELYPADFKQLPRNRLGKGSYGTVYKAEWRGQTVAVKAIELPTKPQNERKTAQDAHVVKLKKITKDFVAEVDVGCELLHPNLVQMLGYATEPTLYIIQELLTGGSLDKQLYTEHWRPDLMQLLQGALDIARGMEHLHTHFERGGRDSKRCVRPVIHRDLKSPNILCDRPPPLGQGAGEWTVEMKVSDFGLSRDKNHDTMEDKTGAMTGCGSVLWMAPEMLRGDSYNEAVDVYSFAMCLIELSHCTMPWQDTGARPHEVPVRVTSDERPVSQLREARETPEMEKLIRDCWNKDPAARPSFTEIVRTVEDMQQSAYQERGERLSNVLDRESEFEEGSYRPATTDRHSNLSGLEDSPGRPADVEAGSRPASPGPGMPPSSSSYGSTNYAHAEMSMGGTNSAATDDTYSQAERSIGGRTTATSAGATSAGSDDCAHAEMSMGGRSTATSAGTAASDTSF